MWKKEKMLVTSIFSFFHNVFIPCCSQTSSFGLHLMLSTNTFSLVTSTILLFNPLPDDKISDWSKLKHSADNNFEVDVNSRKFSKLVENTVGKREIARYKQFLLFPQCFQKTCFPGASKGVIVWEWINPLPNGKM